MYFLYKSHEQLQLFPVRHCPCCLKLRYDTGGIFDSQYCEKLFLAILYQKKAPLQESDRGPSYRSVGATNYENFLLRSLKRRLTSSRGTSIRSPCFI
jgi:hypothetical protein